MLYTIVVVLLIAWLVSLFTDFGGNFIHLLLVVAAIIFLYNLFAGRRKV
jgi:hypothetical protein